MSHSRLLDKLRPHVEKLLADEALVIAPFPSLSHRIDRTLSDAGVGGELADLVVTDLALTQSLIAFARRTSGDPALGSAAAAVAALAPSEVFAISLCDALGAEVAAPGPLQRLRADAWRKAVLRAQILATLAARRGASAHAWFACGLLWTFGRIPLLSALERLLARFSSVRPRDAQEWLEVVDHFDAAMSDRLVASWQLPDFVRDALLTRHESFDRNAAPALAALWDAIAIADKIGFLLDKGGYPSPAQLVEQGMEPDEAAWFVELIPQLVERVWLLGPSQLSQAIASAVVSVPDTLTQPVIAVRLRAVEMQPTGPVERTCVGFAKNGFIVESEEGLALESTASFVLHTPDAPISVIAKVVHAEPTIDSRVRTELKHIGLVPEFRERWHALIDAAKWQPQAVPMSSDSEGSGVRLMPDFEAAAARPGLSGGSVVHPRPAVDASREFSDPFAAYMSSPARRIVQHDAPKRRRSVLFVAVVLGAVIAALVGAVVALRMV